MDERRTEPRQRVVKPGKIVFNNLCSVFDCRIRDLAAGGARLSLESSVGVPDTFEFVGPLGSGRRSAHIVWRGESEVGIAFG